MGQHEINEPAKVKLGGLRYLPAKKGFGLMANSTPDKLSRSSGTPEKQEYVLRKQKFLSGDTMIACSCGEIRVFPNARREGKCPRGNPWVCMAQMGLPLTSMRLDDA